MRRRRFFQFLSSILATLVALLMGLPGMAFLVRPLQRHRAARKARPLVRLHDLPLHEPRKIVLSDRRRDAWVRYPEGPIGSVWVVRVAQREVKAFSAICPHLGCLVDFQTSEPRYVCPCHEAAFNAQGEIIRGPQRRGLDRLEAALETIAGEEWVSVVYERFEQGTVEKIALG